LNLLQNLLLEQNQISTLEGVTNIETIVQLATGNNCLVRA